MGLRDKRKNIEEKLLDVDASMSGTLSFRDPVNMRINGKFEGTLEVKGNLTIGDTAVVEAHIVGDNITISGKVKGDIIAKQRLTLTSTAVVNGDVRAPKLNIIEGAILQGRCIMLGDVLDSEELARYLEIDLDSILDWANSGKVPAFKDNNEWRFERKKIDEWISKGALK
ncbi:MAG: polymer-forming cytoskeletal protein [Candidatus Omnitrophota bacterium]